MSSNQSKPWPSRTFQSGRGRGDGPQKTQFDSRQRGGSTSSYGSVGASDKDTVAPIFINPRSDMKVQLEQLKKERASAKYNVILPFRRAKIFCPRSYQQSLYTPTLILVQEILSLAEASCSSSMTEEEEKEASGRFEQKAAAPTVPAPKQATKYFLDG